MIDKDKISKLSLEDLEKLQAFQNIQMMNSLPPGQLSLSEQVQWKKDQAVSYAIARAEANEASERLNAEVIKR